MVGRRSSATCADSGSRSPLKWPTKLSKSHAPPSTSPCSRRSADERTAQSSELPSCSLIVESSSPSSRSE